MASHRCPTSWARTDRSRLFTQDAIGGIGRVLGDGVHHNHALETGGGPEGGAIVDQRRAQPRNRVTNIDFVGEGALRPRNETAVGVDDKLLIVVAKRRVESASHRGEVDARLAPERLADRAGEGNARGQGKIRGLQPVRSSAGRDSGGRLRHGGTQVEGIVREGDAAVGKEGEFERVLVGNIELRHIRPLDAEPIGARRGADTAAPAGVEIGQERSHPRRAGDEPGQRPGGGGVVRRFEGEVPVGIDEGLVVSLTEERKGKGQGDFTGIVVTEGDRGSVRSERTIHPGERVAGPELEPLSLEVQGIRREDEVALIEEHGHVPVARNGSRAGVRTGRTQFAPGPRFGGSHDRNEVAAGIGGAEGMLVAFRGNHRSREGQKTGQRETEGTWVH